MYGQAVYECVIALVSFAVGYLACSVGKPKDHS